MQAQTNRTSNKTTDPIYTAALAAQMNRPLLSAIDIEFVHQLLATNQAWLRVAYRTLQQRPELLQFIRTAAAQQKVLMDRLIEIQREQAGRAH